MIKMTVHYTDFDGNEAEEDLYFNLSKAEIAEMELAAEGGFQKKLQEVINSNNGQLIIDTFKDILLRSYGVRSDDGKRFIKSKQLSEEFSQTAAFSELFMTLVTDADQSAAFINGVVPKDLADRVAATNNNSQDNQPAYIRENRQPTPEELRAMSREELAVAMERVTKRVTE